MIDSHETGSHETDSHETDSHETHRHEAHRHESGPHKTGTPVSGTPVSGTPAPGTHEAGTHENFSRLETVQPSSNRTFGLVFAAFFFLVASLPLLRGHAWRWWALPCSAAFLSAALLAPKILGPLNQVWTAFGSALHKVTNPIILGIFFYLVFAPFGWVLRRMGKDFLRLRPAPQADSYWIPRQPPGPEPASMSKQF